MNGIQRYIFSGVAKAMLAIAAVALAVVCLLKSLLFIQLTVSQGLSIGSYIYLVVLLFPTLLLLVLPIAVFVSVLFVYGKLTSDSEILAMRACGLGNLALARPAVAVGAGATMLAYVMSLYFVPVSFKEFKDIEYFVQVRLAAMVLREGEFNRLGTKVTIYMRDRTASGELTNVLFQDDRDPEFSRTIVAERAILNRTGEVYKLLLESGNVQEFERKSRRVSVVHFDRYVLELDIGELVGRGQREAGIAERHIGGLLAPPTATRRDRELRGKAMAEGHQRLASPLLCLSFLAIALAALFHGDFSRRGSIARMALAAGIVTLVQSLHLLIVNAASLSPILLPAIHLNAILPGLVAAMLLYRGDRRIARPAGTGLPAGKEAVAGQ